VVLKTLSDEQRLSVTAKLAHEILAHAAETSTVMVEELAEALRDTFLVLKSPLLQLRGRGGGGTDDDGAELDDEGAVGGTEGFLASLANAKGHVLKKAAKQHMMEHVLPIVVALKTRLEAQRSPVQHNLMEYLVHVSRTCKEEMAQVLASDPVLVQEIQYDLKQFEKMKRQPSDSHTTPARAKVGSSTPADKDYENQNPQVKELEATTGGNEGTQMPMETYTHTDAKQASPESTLVEFAVLNIVPCARMRRKLESRRRSRRAQRKWDPNQTLLR
jgi:condensin-2 complex subunit D3